MNPTLTRFIDHVFPTTAITIGDFSVVPFVGRSRMAPPLVVYGPSLVSKVRLGEKPGGATVPVITVTNDLEEAVLILDGQHLVGARQNRVLNTDVLVKPRSTMDVPVSCVEQGRWAMRHAEFSPGSASPRSFLQRKHVRVTDSLKSGRGHDADQRGVWQDVAREIDRVRRSSPTAALEDVAVADGTQVAHLATEVRTRLPIDALGIAVFARGWFLGMDLFDRRDSLLAAWETVFGGYAREHVRGFRSTVATPPMGQPYLDRVQHDLLEGAWTKHPAIGLGEDHRLSTRHISASALNWDDGVVHLEVFPALT